MLSSVQAVSALLVAATLVTARQRGFLSTHCACDPADAKPCPCMNKLPADEIDYYPDTPITKEMLREANYKAFVKEIIEDEDRLIKDRANLMVQRLATAQKQRKDFKTMAQIRSSTDRKKKADEISTEIAKASQKIAKDAEEAGRRAQREEDRIALDELKHQLEEAKKDAHSAGKSKEKANASHTAEKSGDKEEAKATKANATAASKGATTSKETASPASSSGTATPEAAKAKAKATSDDSAAKAASPASSSGTATPEANAAMIQSSKNEAALAEDDPTGEVKAGQVVDGPATVDSSFQAVPEGPHVIPDYGSCEMPPCGCEAPGQVPPCNGKADGAAAASLSQLEPAMSFEVGASGPKEDPIEEMISVGMAAPMATPIDG